jgi:hypothetical protein
MALNARQMRSPIAASALPVFELAQFMSVIAPALAQSRDI